MAVAGALAGAFARRLPPCGSDCERLGGSPRLWFAPKVRALARALAARWQGSLPAGCRQAAVIAVGRKPPAVVRTGGARAGKGVGRAFAGSVCPQAAARRL